MYIKTWSNIINKGQQSFKSMVKHRQKHNQHSLKSVVKHRQKTWSQIIKNTWSTIIKKHGSAFLVFASFAVT
jgi:hypothetical protein